MTSVRPRRKATINMSYNDTLEEFPLEEANSKVTPSVDLKKASSKRSSIIASSKATDSKAVAEVPSIPYNYQMPPAPGDYFSNRLDLTDAYINLKTQMLYCPYQEPAVSTQSKRKSKQKDIFTLSKGDYIYMVSEPPGEPYYIGRIMGFKEKSSFKSPLPEEKSQTVNEQAELVDASKYQFQMQWFYRPRDISKSTSDSRVLFASMHTDTCPMASFRGLVTVKHKQDIEDESQYAASSLKANKPQNQKKSASPGHSSTAIDLYIQNPNCFYFDKLFDRYMIKFYDILSTSNLLQYAVKDNNTSRNFLTALNKRFEYIFVESQRTKSFINTFSSNSCNCEKCGQWCGSTQDSITCAVCNDYYHMYCLEPPLLKKPSRGFSWSCAVCTKKYEIEYHKKKMLMLSHDNKSSNEDQLHEELSVLSSFEAQQADEFPVSSQTEEDSETETPLETLPKYESMAVEFLEKDSTSTFEERRIKEEWPMRYLGMHARLEDAVDLDDRSPYPRAATRLGAKHQATNIPEFYDHPIVYYDLDKQTSNGKKKTNGGFKSKLSKEKANEVDNIKKLEIPDEYKDLNKRDFPQWLQPRPKGYLERGVDDGEGVTCTSLWKSSESDIEDDFKVLDRLLEDSKSIAEKIGILPTSPNFMDAVVYSYMESGYDADAALKKIAKLNKKLLKEPTFSKDEIKRFESGIKEFGSELYPVYKRNGISLELNSVTALCFRCAKLWRRYAVIWEDPNEVEGKNSKSIGWKKKVEPELLEDSKAVMREAERLGAIISYDKGDSAKIQKKESSVSAPDTPNKRMPSAESSVEPVLKKKKVNNVTQNDTAKSKKVTIKTENNIPIKQSRSKKVAVVKPIIENTIAKPKPIKRKIEDEVISSFNKSSENGSMSSTKKVKKITGSVHDIPFPITNSGYSLINLPSVERSKDLNDGILRNLLDNFRIRQVSNMQSQFSPLHVPAQSTVSVPFNPNERKCSICREHDINSKSSLEMLICSTCGVNIHASCAGIQISEKITSPAKEWLCEVCINDTLPHNSTIYSCSLCFANESNYELSFLGSTLVRPDFLKPINASTKWCHVLCAIFNHGLVARKGSFANPSNSISFRQGKSDIAFDDSQLSNNLKFEEVADTFLRGYHSTCGICSSRNGSVISCEMCDSETKYHITCAQDTPNFKLGFGLDHQPLKEKDACLIDVNNSFGILKPILICPKHDQTSSTIFGMRTLGKRVHGGGKEEAKPLIQLFLEDLTRTNNSSKSGPQSKSKLYVESCKVLKEGDKEYLSWKNNREQLTRLRKEQAFCCDCKTTTSPMWWKEDKPDGGINYRCQSCYHTKNDSEKDENDSDGGLVENLDSPLNGVFYGIEDLTDNVSAVFIPRSKVSREKKVIAEVSRSKISLGDILG
ncbi:PHD type zinc finger protein with BAH domain-containing protein [Scheffersomyces coipomensis]|uniref:PHD type zinc finger protein with BAH domain-containing protein n=1 Tax=Scheffersomyces coipomensis TaxID=1788519 RepID=UPI00315D12C4